MAFWGASSGSARVLRLLVSILGVTLAEEAKRFLQAESGAPEANSTLRGSQPSPSDCSMVAGCRGLSGLCCPAPDGAYLNCCHEPAPPRKPGSEPLAMVPSCDDLNVGFPNCGDAAKCEGEYLVNGAARILRATSASCAYVTFKTGLSLQDVLQMDADVFISQRTCRPYDNLAFWFFQTTEDGATLENPTQHWDALSEVDLMETYIGVGGVNSINTNFAATGIHKAWANVTIESGVHQHVTMWQDTENVAGCPETRSSAFMGALEPLDYGKELPVVSVYVAHCAPGAPCCEGEGCKALRSDPHTAQGCITVKEAPILMALSNWGAGHQVTPGCEVGASDVTVRTK